MVEVVEVYRNAPEVQVALLSFVVGTTTGTTNPRVPSTPHTCSRAWQVRRTGSAS